MTAKLLLLVALVACVAAATALPAVPDVRGAFSRARSAARNPAEVHAAFHATSPATKDRLRGALRYVNDAHVRQDDNDNDDDGPGPACMSALAGYISAGCTNTYFDIFALFSGDDESADNEGPFDFLGDPAEMCPHEDECRPKLFSAMLVCATEGAESDADAAAEVAAVTQMFSLILDLACLEADGEYCLPLVNDMFSDDGGFFDDESDGGDDDGDSDDGFFGGGMPTTAELTQMCHPCTQRVLSYMFVFLSNFADDDGFEGDFDDEESDEGFANFWGAFMGLMCMREGDRFCVQSVFGEGGFIAVCDNDGDSDDDIHVEENVRDEDDDSDDSDDTACMNAVFTQTCTDMCVRRVISYMSEHGFFGDDSGDDDGDDTHMFNAIVKYACRRDEAGELCGVLDIEPLSEKYMAESECTEPVLFDQKCGSVACKAVVEQMRAEAGCCLGSTLAFLQAVAPGDEAVTVGNIVANCNAAGVDLNACPRRGRKVEKTAVLRAHGLCAWFHANEDEALATLRRDIAANLGVSADAVEITDTDCDSASRRQAVPEADTLKVDWALSSDDDAAADLVEASFDTAVEQNAFVFTEFTDDFTAANPGVSIEFDATATRDANTGVVAGASALLVAVATFLALLL